MAKPKFKESGGVIVLPIPMLDSLAYQHLSAKAIKLLLLIQRYWRQDKAVNYGITQTTQLMRCSRSTASTLFNELKEHGFIAIVDEADFYANKARSWRLTYRPFLNKEPTHDLKNWIPKIEAIVRLRNQHCYCHRTPMPIFNLDWFCQRTGA